MEVNQSLLLPAVGLAAWTYVMWAWMYATRIPAIQRSGMKLDGHIPRGEQMATLPAVVRWKADNYNHLFEQPTDGAAPAPELAADDILPGCDHCGASAGQRGCRCRACVGIRRAAGGAQRVSGDGEPDRGAIRSVLCFVTGAACAGCSYRNDVAAGVRVAFKVTVCDGPMV